MSLFKSNAFLCRTPFLMEKVNTETIMKDFYHEYSQCYLTVAEVFQVTLKYSYSLTTFSVCGLQY